MAEVELPETQREQQALHSARVQPSDITLMCERINNYTKVLNIISLILNIRAKVDSLKQYRGIQLAPRQSHLMNDSAKIALLKVAQYE